MIRVLSVLLALQLVVTLVLYWPRQQGAVPSEALVRGLGPESIERIGITDGEGASNALTREGDGWRLQSGLPADPGKVATLLTALTGGDPGYAIATSDSAATRFRVAEDDFERRIELAGDGTERVLYLGTSPAFRKVHARRDGEAGVFVIELNSYDAPTEDNSWLDRSLLAATDLSSLALYGVRLRLDGDRWVRDDGAEVDADAMEELIQALSRLQVSGLAGADDEEAAEAGEALRITLGEGDIASRLTVLDNSDSERYYLSSDRFEPVFNTSAYDAERLIEAARTVAGIAEAEAADGDPEEAAGRATEAERAAGEAAETPAAADSELQENPRKPAQGN